MRSWTGVDRKSLNSSGTKREREVEGRTFSGRRLCPYFSTQTFDYPLAGSKADAAAGNRGPMQAAKRLKNLGCVFLFQSCAVIPYCYLPFANHFIGFYYDERRFFAAVFEGVSYQILGHDHHLSTIGAEARQYTGIDCRSCFLNMMLQVLKCNFERVLEINDGTPLRRILDG